MKKILLATTLLLAACASSTGTMVSQQQAASFQRGKTTCAEIIDQLGQPDTTVTSNGSTTLGYMHNESHIAGQSFVPVVGIFMTSVDAKMHAAAFTCNAKGVLTSVTSSDAGNTLRPFGE